jgi:hypothetical protein
MLFFFFAFVLQIISYVIQKKKKIFRKASASKILTYEKKNKENSLSSVLLFFPKGEKNPFLFVCFFVLFPSKKQKKYLVKTI